MSVGRPAGLPRVIFVTGTDTGIGKTRISLGLIERLKSAGLRVAAMKPVASGCARTPQGLRNADALALQAAASFPIPYERLNPYAFEPPIAPHLAAERAGEAIRLEPLRKACAALAVEADVVVVEGVGGWAVPLGEHLMLADLAAELAASVLLVVGMRLGCLNHALLTAAAVEARGLPWYGWVANQVEPVFAAAEANLHALRARLSPPLRGVVPWLEGAEVADVARCLWLDETGPG
ncbi:dethiobiotin synthase [Thiohalobacter sp. IOR34]|uniref:dethiobiotin synthase n=1 Tax=Thiohalobacter sp. IOR34 TaxID=3057176 RepID=UPI0025B1C1F1|nr:dethiobiotin synthase [Thiohalobacter sp. IOR34]WJW75728.1 dethiobiotin synthase [Thiohalobacter sp. IOR34]